MKKGWILGVFAFLISVRPITATTFVNRTLEDVIHEAVYIVRGQTGSSYADYEKTTSGRIFTYTHLSITEVLKGDLKEKQILIRQPGGAKDGIEMHVPGTAHFNLNEEVVVLLGQKNTNDNDSYDVPGFTTGKYNIVKKDNGEIFLSNSLGGAALVDSGRADSSLHASYNSELSLDTFRKIAKGKNIPEATHKQFKETPKPQSPSHQHPEHQRHEGSQTTREIKQEMSAPAGVEQQNIVSDSANSLGIQKSIWIPISFAILLAFAGFGLFKALKIFIGFSFFVFGISHLAYAHVFFATSSGNALYWASPSAPTFYANYLNNSGLSYAQVFTAFTNALNRWKYAGSGSVGFDYWQGSNSATPTAWGYDKRNAIFFSSKSSQKLGGSTLGVTYLYYYTNGQLAEADVEFNDDSFIFSTDVTQTSNSGDGKHVFIENVATHEFGHAFGLTHSASLQSSMVYIETRGQAKLSCDDIHAIGALYPSSSFTTGRGTISGSVANGSSAIFGAHVLAISKTRGTVVSSAISQSNGNYTIPNLEPGSYYLMVEPFQMSQPITALCGGNASGCYYGTVNSHTACSGAPFKRAFIETSTGVSQSIAVNANQTTSVASYNISCSNMAGGTPSSTDLDAPTLLSNNSGGSVSFAGNYVMGGAGTQHFFKLLNVSGKISVKVLSYSLYSSFDPSVNLLDSFLNATNETVSNNVFTNSSNYTNYDASATLADAGLGTYYIRVKNDASLASSTYPVGSSQIDSVKFYLLIVTINDATSFLPSNDSPTLTNNARCEAPDSFTAFSDHGTPSETSSASSPSSESSSGGGTTTTETESSIAIGCGTIHNHNGPKPPFQNMLFSSWGMLFMLIVVWLGYKALRQEPL